jgi:hypothetical protein
LHDVGQLPSQVSPGSTTLFPQLGEQSVSVVASHPVGQQASPPIQLAITGWLHAVLQLELLPVMMSIVQALPSLQEVGQLLSQVSPGSTTPFPHDGEQSESETELHPPAQHPSPFAHTLITWCAHTTLQLLALPVIVSIVQGLPSPQEVGQSPSQVSPGSIIELPQEDEQLSSIVALQPMGQQPSPFAQVVID